LYEKKERDKQKQPSLSKFNNKKIYGNLLKMSLDKEPLRLHSY